MKLTNEQFCKMVQGYDGEPCNSVHQIRLWRFNGEELKELIEHCINFNNDNVDNIESLKNKVFTLANNLAILGEGDAAVSMHRIHNKLL
jgi:hypothetical protein